MPYPIISADSHITEAPDTYSGYMDGKYAADAPRLLENEDGVAFRIPKMGDVKLGPASAAGIPPAKRREAMRTLADLHRGGWDSSVRAADQERDGVSAEILYPTLGMVLCNHPDMEYKEACFAGYNRWIAEYCSFSPERFLGIGQTAMRSPESGIKDLENIKAAGLRGVMMPGEPGVEDYDSPAYDEFWAAAAEIGLPVSFHIVAVGGRAPAFRGPKVNMLMSTMRGVQDVIGMLIYGGVFQRHPTLKVICVEGDAGWVPHYAHKLDRAYSEHRHHAPSQDLDRKPSEYLFEHLYFTFQDDPIAFRLADSMNWRRLMWANDFPHSDSTWPYSQALLEEHTAQVTPEQKRAILSDNVAALYNIDTSRLDTRLAA